MKDPDKFKKGLLLFLCFCVIAVVALILHQTYSTISTVEKLEKELAAERAKNAEKIAKFTETLKKLREQAEKPILTIDQRLAKLAQVKIKVDVSAFPKEHAEWMKPTLVKLIEAAKIMDRIFLKQVNSNNRRIRMEIVSRDSKTLRYFDAMFGPWDRLAENKLFWSNEQKPKGAGFYPKDLTKEEFEKWITDHPKDKEAFESYFTVIHRFGPEKERLLIATPYSHEYIYELGIAAQLLEEAAKLSKDERLSNYLRLRAQAFKTNNYRESDMAWMDLGDCPIEFVIGPYETYEDELLGLKAAFEAFVTIRNPADSAELSRFVAYLPEWRDNLPVEPQYKSFPIQESPLSVVAEIYTGGDARKVFTPVAFMLPNDPEVWKAKGTKKVLLKNIGQAKFDNCTYPIAKRVLVPLQSQVSFDAYWKYTLCHELSHGLLPSEIEVNGEKTTVNKALKDLYGPLEECRADATSIYNLQYLIDKGILSKEFEAQLYATTLAGLFRSARFGEAHGIGAIIIFNYLSERKAYLYNQLAKGFFVDIEPAKSAIRDLVHDLFMLEVTGDYEGAKKFLEKYSKISPEMKAMIEKLSDIPVDILPEFDVDNLYNTRSSHGSLM